MVEYAALGRFDTERFIESIEPVRWNRSVPDLVPGEGGVVNPEVGGEGFDRKATTFPLKGDYPPDTYVVNVRDFCDCCALLAQRVLLTCLLISPLLLIWRA